MSLVRKADAFLIPYKREVQMHGTCIKRDMQNFLNANSACSYPGFSVCLQPQSIRGIPKEMIDLQTCTTVVQMAERSVGLFVYIKHKPVDTMHFSAYNHW